VTDLLDDILRNGRPSQEPQGDPLDDVLARAARARMAAAQQSAGSPEAVGKANQIARKTGIPPSVVEAHLPAFEGQERANRLRELSSTVGGFRRWASDPRHAALAADDTDAITKLAARVSISDKADFAKGSGFFDRMGDLLNRAVYSLDEGAASFRGALLDWSARNPLPWTSAENRQAEVRKAAQSRAIARVYGDTASTKIANETTWADVKTGPSLRSVGGFVLDQGVGSLPAMAMSAVGLPMLVASQAGSIGRNRAQSDGREDASIKDIGIAMPAATISSLLDRYGLESILKATGKNVLIRAGKAGAAEGGTEFAQSFIEYSGATVGTERGFDLASAFDQGFAGLVAGSGTGAALNIAFDAAGSAGKKVAQRLYQADASLSNQVALDQVMEAAAQSKVRQRDPEAFRSLMAEIGKDGEVESLYISAEAAHSYMQSDGYDGEFDAYRAAVEDGLATGGDIVIPLSEAAAALAGTKAWAAVRDDVRVTPGGMSPREAATFNEAMADVMAEFTEQMEAQDQRQRAALKPVEEMVQSLTERLENAGFTPHTARQQAEFLTQRAQTRATRTGREFTGQEYNDLAINQVLPEKLAAAQKADRLDFVINAMKRKADVNAAPGVSLLEFVTAKGGVKDPGGDLQEMGAQDWHKGKAFRKRLINEKGRTLDDLAMAAFEAGYFPGMTERPSINEFLDAMGRELGGSPVFANFVSEDAAVADTAQAQLVQAADELRALLAEAGIDPVKASAKEIRDAVAQFSERAQGAGFDQSFADGPRGRITFPTSGYGRGKTVIDLFQSRDQSTFLHETGHLWLEELRFDALDPNASDQLKADWKAVQDWFKANKVKVGKDGTIPVKAHEMWARGVERYLMEGKAPSPSLRKMFETFKSWLVQVYRTVSKLNAPITDDIRAVMDRLIATDEEIADAREEQALEAAFTEKPSTMTDGEWTEYQKLATDARETAHDALLAKVMAGIKKRVTKEYRDAKEAVRAEVAQEIDARPEFRALAAVRAQPIDAAWVRDTYGPDATAMLPKAVPPVYRDGGAHPDEVAETLGFKSGDEMVRALMGIEARRLQLREGGDKRSVREVMIAQETEARMNERYGDPFTDGSIEEEALAAVHNDKQGELIAADLRVLSRSTGQQATPYRVAKAWAARTIREGKVSDMISRSALQRYRRAAQGAGQKAIEAILNGDSDEAFLQKQAQMLNNALLSEGARVAEEVDAVVKRLSAIAKRKTSPTIDQDYLERAQALLEQVEMRPRSQRSIERQAQFEAWAQAQRAAGHDIVVPDSFAASIGTTHWTRLSVEQMLGLGGAVDQIIHLGRLKQTLLDNKERREFDAVRAEAIGQMGGMDKRPPSDLMEPSRWDGIKAKIASSDAALLKMETVFDWLDQGNPEGVFNRIVFRPIAEAQHHEQAKLKDYVLKVQGLTKALPKAMVKRWRDKFTDPRLVNRTTGNPYVFTRDQLVSMALNMGNASNRAKLAGGYGWNEQAVMDVLNDNLSMDEWAYVQSIWDTIESLWPEIEAMEKRLNGVAPEKIEATPFWAGPVAEARPLRGGYFPVVYDPAKSIEADVNAAKSSDLFENIYTRANTSRGFTKERTNVERPIWLNLGVIDRHLGEVIHDLTHREAIMQADKFLSDKRIMQAVDETLGPEVRRQFRPWLQHIANEWAYDRAGLAGAEKFLRALRRNTTFVGMGFRASTVMMQLAGFSDSTGTIGEKAMLHGLTVFSKNPKAAIDFVLERSGEVRSRMNTLDRDIRDTARRHAGQKGILSEAQRFGYIGIGWADRLVVVPTWIGAYDKALKSGADEADAIYAADKAVRVAQGSGAAKDLAAVQRGRGASGEAFKLLTMFYSYASGYYQRLRTLGRDVRRANISDIPNLMARSFWLVIVPALAAAVLAGRWPDEEDDEGWAEWAFKEIAISMVNPIPFLRDAAPVAISRFSDEPTFGYSFSPTARAFETGINVVGDLGNVIEGEDTKRATRNFLEAAGYVTGAVPGQVATSAQFIVDIGYGEQDPQTMGEWLEGLQKGKVKED
jgi:hypothetical protein